MGFSWLDFRDLRAVENHVGSDMFNIRVFDFLSVGVEVFNCEQKLAVPVRIRFPAGVAETVSVASVQNFDKISNSTAVG